MLRPRHIVATLAGMVVLFALASCSFDAPSMDKIRDSKLLDRRINETPRQKIIRECSQETERFRVSCLHCHETDKIADIKSEDAKLTKIGSRAQIMRASPSFGLNQDCAQCHQSKFKLNRNAEKLFGPGGSKYLEAQKELKIDK